MKPGKICSIAECALSLVGGVVRFKYVSQDGDVSDSHAFFEKCFKDTIQRPFSKCHPYARVML